MARQTRQQRRDRRAKQQPPQAERQRKAARAPEAEQERRPERREREVTRRGIPGVRFVQESAAELKKVEWPDQPAVVSGTAVVMIACLIVGAFLWANDEVWKYVVQHVLLR